jgi:hypothetical protein
MSYDSWLLSGPGGPDDYDEDEDQRDYTPEELADLQRGEEQMAADALQAELDWEREMARENDERRYHDYTARHANG